MRKDVARLTRNLNEIEKTFAEGVRAILEELYSRVLERGWR